LLLKGSIWMISITLMVGFYAHFWCLFFCVPSPNFQGVYPPVIKRGNGVFPPWLQTIDDDYWWHIFPFKAPFLGDITFPRFVNRRLYAIVFQAPALPKVSLLRRPDPVMRWKNRWFLWCLNEWWLIDGSLMVHWWLMKLIYPYGISMVNDGWMGIYQWGFYDAELLLNYVELCWIPA